MMTDVIEIGLQRWEGGILTGIAGVEFQKLLSVYFAIVQEWHVIGDEYLKSSLKGVNGSMSMRNGSTLR